MNNLAKIRIYGGLLTLFGLFAVYSTSIWKSFEQRTTVNIIQNIETVKAFNTFLDETILSSTQKILEKKIPTQETALISGAVEATGTSMAAEESLPIIPTLSTLETEGDDPAQLVANTKQKVQKRNNYILFSNQIRNLIVAVIAVLIVLFIPLPLFKEKKLIYFITIAVFLFQLLVFIPSLAATNGNARGRVDFPGLPNMQPAEFFKLGYVFFMSYWISKRKSIIDSKQFLMQFGAINAIILLIILAIPDFGTLFILALTGTIMARYGGLKVKKIGILAGVAGVVVLLGIGFLSAVKPDSYAFVRLTTFWERNPEVRKEFELREGRQIQQGLIAIGGGGFFGQGYGKGLQKMGQLPEAYSDMIFAAFSEEIGFVGNFVLFVLYFGLFWSVLKLLPQVRDPQLKTLAVGIISLIVVQVFVHIGVNLEILPNTGLTLPFVSHGGTALMINLIELALLYKILRGK